MRAAIVVAAFLGVAAAGGHKGGKKQVTSTIYTTEIKTITSCQPEITECAGKHGNHGPVYVTETVPLTTTVCEVDDDEEETSTSSMPMPTETETKDHHKKPKVTKTLYTTEIKTVTDCPETVTDCPAHKSKGHHWVVTETVPVTTTVCDADEEPTYTPTETPCPEESSTKAPHPTKEPCHTCGGKEPVETSTYCPPSTMGTTYVPAPTKSSMPVTAGAGRVEGGLIAAVVGLAAALL